MNPFDPLTPLSAMPEGEEAEQLSKSLLGRAQELVTPIQRASVPAAVAGSRVVPSIDPSARTRPFGLSGQQHEELGRIEQALEGLVESQASRLEALELAGPGGLADPAERAIWDKAVELQRELVAVLMQRKELVREMYETVNGEATQVPETNEATVESQPEDSPTQEPPAVSSRVAPVWSDRKALGSGDQAAQETDGAMRSKLRGVSRSTNEDGPDREMGTKRGGGRKLSLGRR